MKFIPYGRQWIDDEDIEEVIKILKGEWVTTGPMVKKFEDALCKYIGCNYVVAVNSGTSALDIAVHALNLPKGSEIITTPFTFAATSNSIVYNNLKPVFVDICRDTRNINPSEIKKKITRKTKAISYVDFAGHPADIDEITEIAEEHGLYLIEDACHALGAEYRGRKIGNFADVTIFSFHPVKHITTGEGGMAATHDEKLYEKFKMLRNHGIDKETRERYGIDATYAYDMKYLGRNYRITDFQCALGLSQLKKLDRFIEKRQHLAHLYSELLKDVDFIELPVTKEHVTHVWHIYTVLLDESIDRDTFFSYMRNRNIGVNVHYIPVYKHSYYIKNFNFDPKRYPVTEEVFKRTITLPLHPQMGDEHVEYVVNTASSFRKSE
ncbi:MAG: UDP-4-amino-4,6-dideoxy-N-acetyl-beta-L-altrosamine transaminase [Theionarchaea archaeon]|nr:MAG: UDP-4-amino-4,6-dideoxy-N-acetyl-beta-L-altrosamine transaminase [Theionarchaea archaeon DG-70-1]MBU7025608.1 UDP-4-amino-4,6-dideoxy-N-acetyl-beta-L-altrosamine transaminase [Theionarchaea archaeon]